MSLVRDYFGTLFASLRVRLILFILACGLVGITVRLWMAVYTIDHQREVQAREELLGIFAAEIPPTPAQVYPGAPTALDSILDLSEHRSCQGAAARSVNCRQILSLHEAAQVVSRHLQRVRFEAGALTAPAQGATPPLAEPDAGAADRSDAIVRDLRLGMQRVLGHTVDLPPAWAEQALAYASALPQLRSRDSLSRLVQLEPCRRAAGVESEAARRHVGQHGWAGCDARPVRITELIIPSRLLSTGMTAKETWPVEAEGDALEALYPLPVLAGAQLSQVLDLAVELMLKWRLDRGDAELDEEEGGVRDRGPSLVQAYFIAPEGLVRMWSEEGLSYDHLGPHNLFSEAWYVRVHTGTQQWSQNEPYIDAGENGLVRTRCTPVHMPAIHTDAYGEAADSKSPWSEPDHPLRKKGPLGGLLCTDEIPMTASELEERLTRRTDGSLIQTGVIAVADRGARVERLDGPAIESLDFQDRDALRRTITSTPPEQLLRQVTMVPLDSDAGAERKAFLVPITSAPEEHSGLFRLAVIYPHPMAGTPYLGWPVLLSLTLGGLAILFGLVRVQLAQYEREEVYVRSLPVGFLSESDDGHIVLGNDRAEELLGITLPPVGQRPPRPTARFADVIEPVIYLRSDGRIGERTTYDDLMALRREGEFSSYYAKVLHPDEHRETWVLVSGSPIINEAHSGKDALFRDNDRSTRPTFGTIRQLTEAERIALEAHISSLQVHDSDGERATEGEPA